MLVPRIIAVLVAVGMLFAPTAMNRAMAAAPVASHEGMSEGAHCSPAEQQADKSDVGEPERCCVATCAATAVAPAGIAVKPLLGRVPQFSALASIPGGVLSEIETPPPRG